jgi:hypothetical protein
MLVQSKINVWCNLNTALTYSTMAEFRDDYRDETIMTYKEWLRQHHQLYNINNFQCFHWILNIIFLMVNINCWSFLCCLQCHMYRRISMVRIHTQRMKTKKATPQLESGHLMFDFLRIKERVAYCTLSFSSMFKSALLIVFYQFILNGWIQVATTMCMVT